MPWWQTQANQSLGTGQGGGISQAQQFGGGVTEGQIGTANPPTTWEDPFQTAARFHQAYNGMPAHQVRSLTMAGTPPTPQTPQNPQTTTDVSAVGPSASTAPTATPAQAGAMNAAMPGTFNGNMTTGIPAAEGGFSRQWPPRGHQQKPSWAQGGFPTIAPPGHGPNPGLAGQVATPTPAPAPTPAPPSNMEQMPEVRTPMPAPVPTPGLPVQTAAAGESSDATRDPTAPPPVTDDASKAPKGTEGETTPAPVMTAAPGQDQKQAATVMPNPTAKSAPVSPNVTFNYGGKSYTVTAPKPSNWPSMTDAQRQKWLTAHAAGTATVTPGPTPNPGSTNEPQTGGTPDAGTPVIETPPSGNVTTDQNGNVVQTPGETPPGGNVVTEEKAATAGSPNDSAQGTQLKDYGNNIVNWIHGSPNVALSGTKLWQALGYAHPDQMGKLPNWQGDRAQFFPGGGNGNGGVSFSGLDLDNSAFVQGSKNYIADPALQSLYVETWRAANALNQASSDGLQDPTKIRAAADKYSALRSAAAQYGINVNALDYSGSTGDTIGGLPGIWNQDPNAPALDTMPALGGISTVLKNVFGVDASSPPEAKAAAFEEYKQWIAAQAAYKDKAKAAGQYAGAVDIFANDPSRVTSEGIANDIAAHPEYSDWEGIKNRAVSDSDKQRQQAIDMVSASGNRRGVAPGALEGMGIDVNRAAGNDLSRQLGELDQAQGAERRQGQLQGIDALGNVFQRYAGGEAAAKQALGNVIAGAPGDYAYTGQGIANLSANNQAIQIAREQVDNAKQAASDANTLGYFSAVTSMLGQWGGAMAGA